MGPGHSLQQPGGGGGEHSGSGLPYALSLSSSSTHDTFTTHHSDAAQQARAVRLTLMLARLELACPAMQRRASSGNFSSQYWASAAPSLVHLQAHGVQQHSHGRQVVDSLHALR